MGFGLVIEFTERLQLVTTNNYNILTSLHTLQITTAHTRSQSLMPSLAIGRLQSSLGIARLWGFFSFCTHVLTSWRLWPPLAKLPEWLSLYGLSMDLIKNIAHSHSCVVVMGHCLAVACLFIEPIPT
jgi:hypothetical protein